MNEAQLKELQDAWNQFVESTQQLKSETMQRFVDTLKEMDEGEIEFVKEQLEKLYGATR